MHEAYEKMIRHIDTHINKEITIDDLIKLAGYSRRRIYQLFEEYAGMPVMEYIRRKRIQTAVPELRTGKKLYEVALNYGYETPAGFCKAFQSIFGCSPSNYRAGIAMNTEKIMERIEKHSRAIEADPSNAELYGFRGYEYATLEQHDKAVEDFSKALEVDPGFLWGYIHRTFSYAQLGQSDKSMEDYNKALEVSETFAWAYSYRGHVYAVLGQHLKAIECYNKSLEINPDSIESLIRRGWSYACSRQHIRAVEDYIKALEADPDSALAYRNRSHSYTQLGEHCKAAEDLKRAEELMKKTNNDSNI